MKQLIVNYIIIMEEDQTMTRSEAWSFEDICIDCIMEAAAASGDAIDATFDAKQEETH